MSNQGGTDIEHHLLVLLILTVIISKMTLTLLGETAPYRVTEPAMALWSLLLPVPNTLDLLMLEKYLERIYWENHGIQEYISGKSSLVAYCCSKMTSVSWETKYNLSKKHFYYNNTIALGIRRWLLQGKLRTAAVTHSTLEKTSIQLRKLLIHDIDSFLNFSTKALPCS